MDPLAADYPWYTPYQFAGNMPIKFIDVGGLEEGQARMPGMPPSYMTRERLIVSAQSIGNKERDRYPNDNGITLQTNGCWVDITISPSSVYFQYWNPSVQKWEQFDLYTDTQLGKINAQAIDAGLKSATVTLLASPLVPLAAGAVELATGSVALGIGTEIVLDVAVSFGFDATVIPVFTPASFGAKALAKEVVGEVPLGSQFRPSVASVMGRGYKSRDEITTTIKNTELLEKLKGASNGDWVKVYEAGVQDGRKVEVHYFRNNTTGEVFDVKSKYDFWHQKECKNLDEKP